MYRGKKILAFIPARGGSKGIKNKNIIPLCGKPLISYTIEAAKKSMFIDTVIVSTDSEKIAEVAKAYGAGVPFMRPPELASDTATTLQAVIHGINTLNSLGEFYDTLILLQPTQPLRDSDDIDNAIEVFFKEEKGLVSVSEVEDHPILIRTIGSDGNLKKLLDCNSTCRRQDMPRYYRVNGCIYINDIRKIDENTSFNDNVTPFVMSKEHSVDIDEIKDLKIAEYYIDIKR